METVIKHDKKEIIQLLIADMRSRKLLMGLEKAGLSSEDFYTNLCDIVLHKMGFNYKQDDSIYIWYEEAMQSVLRHELFYFREKQHELAKRLYDMLLERKYELYPNGSIPRKAAARRLLAWFIKK